MMLIVGELLFSYFAFVRKLTGPLFVKGHSVLSLSALWLESVKRHPNFRVVFFVTDDSLMCLTFR